MRVLRPFALGTPFGPPARQTCTPASPSTHSLPSSLFFLTNPHMFVYLQHPQMKPSRKINIRSFVLNTNTDAPVVMHLRSISF